MTPGSIGRSDGDTGAGPGSPHLVVVGGMAVGKSTVGQLLAARLGRPYRDSDDDLERREGRSGRELAARDGVPALHRWEATHLLEALASPHPAVITAAASVVEDARCVEALAAPFVAWLRARPETELQRMAGDERRRHLGADPVAAMAALVDLRSPRYAAVADVTVDVDEVTPDEVAARILEVFREAVPRPCDRRPRSGRGA